MGTEEKKHERTNRPPVKKDRRGGGSALERLRDRLEQILEGLQVRSPQPVPIPIPARKSPRR